jgi:hypothetical protein
MRQDQRASEKHRVATWPMFFSLPIASLQVNGSRPILVSDAGRNKRWRLIDDGPWRHEPAFAQCPALLLRPPRQDLGVNGRDVEVRGIRGSALDENEEGYSALRCRSCLELEPLNKLLVGPRGKMHDARLAVDAEHCVSGRAPGRERVATGPKGGLNAVVSAIDGQDEREARSGDVDLGEQRLVLRRVVALGGRQTEARASGRCTVGLPLDVGLAWTC